MHPKTTIMPIIANMLTPGRVTPSYSRTSEPCRSCGQGLLSASEKGLDAIPALHDCDSNRNRHGTPLSPPVDGIIGQHPTQAFAHGIHCLLTTAVQDHQEFVLGPTAHEICSSQIAGERTRYDSQERCGCIRSEGGAEVLLPLQTKLQHSERNLQVGEGSESLS